MTNWQIAKRLISAPLLGAAFVVFLPVIGFVLVGKFGIEKMVAAMQKLRYKRRVTA